MALPPTVRVRLTQTPSVRVKLTPADTFRPKIIPGATAAVAARTAATAAASSAAAAAVSAAGAAASVLGALKYSLAQILTAGEKTQGQTNLGLGTAAVKNTGTSGDAVPLLNAVNTFAYGQRFDSSAADYGGGIILEKASTGSTLAGDVTIDTTDNTIWFNETGGTYRGVHIDLTEGAALANTSLEIRSKKGVANGYASLGAGGTIPDAQIPSLAIAKTTGLQAALDAKLDDTQASAFGISLIDDADAAAGRSTLGLGSAATGTLTAFGQSLIDDADAATGRSTLGLGSAALGTLTAFGQSLIDDADATTGRTTLGLGTAATQNTGTSGATIPLLNVANTRAAGWHIATDGGTGAGEWFNGNVTADRAFLGMDVATDSRFRLYSASRAADIWSTDLTTGWTSFSGQQSTKNPLYGHGNNAAVASFLAWPQAGRQAQINADPADLVTWVNYPGRDAVAIYADIQAPPLIAGAAGTFTATVFTRSAGVFDSNELSQFKAGMWLDTDHGTKYMGILTSWTSTTLTTAGGWYQLGNSAAGQVPPGTQNVFVNPITQVWAQNNNVFLMTNSHANTAVGFELGVLNWKGVYDGSAGPLMVGFHAVSIPSTNPVTWRGAAAFLATGNFWRGYIAASETDYAGFSVTDWTASGQAPTYGFLYECAALGGKPFGVISGSTEIWSVISTGQTRIGAAATSHTLVGLGSIELCETGGNAAIDFKNATADDYDARLLLSGGSSLLVYTGGATLSFEFATSANVSNLPMRMKSYTVALLPAGAAGDTAYASNGRKAGEGAGAGTGVLVFFDNNALWKAVDTGATVAA